MRGLGVASYGQSDASAGRARVWGSPGPTEGRGRRHRPARHLRARPGVLAAGGHDNSPANALAGADGAVRRLGLGVSAERS